MLIKVSKYENAYPGSQRKSSQRQASAFGYSALDYFIACVFLTKHHEVVGPLFNLMLPMMHQCLELLVKGLAAKADTNFEPKKFSHRTRDVIHAYSALVPCFAEIMNESEIEVMLEALEESYITVRYGNGVLAYDYEAWELFRRTAEKLFAALHEATGLHFLASQSQHPSTESRG